MCSTCFHVSDHPALVMLDAASWRSQPCLNSVLLSTSSTSKYRRIPQWPFGEQNPSHVNCICILVRHVSSTCVWLHFGILHSTPLLDLSFLAFCLGLNWIYWSMWESCHLDHTSFWIQDTLHFYIHSGLEFLSFRFCSFQLMNFGHLLSDLYLDIKFMLL